MTLTILLIALSTPAICVLCHFFLVVMSSADEEGRQKTAVSAVLISVLVVLVTSLYFESREDSLSLMALGVTLSMSLLLGHLYFHFFNMSETARRIKILVALKKGLEPGLSDSPYSPNEILKIRLARLLALGQVEKTGYSLKSKRTLLTFVARAMTIYENLIFPERA